MKKRVLLTGGLGYLGGRVAQALVSSGQYKLRIASRRLPNPESMPEWLRNQEFVKLDLCSPSEIAKCCDSVSHVLHLAAMNEVECSKQPDKALLANGYGTYLLAEAAAHAGVVRFLYISTAHVYAAPLIGFFEETMVPYPRHPYAISKRVGEDFLLARNDLETIVIRLSNAFGCPVQPDINRWGLVVNDLCRQAAVDQKVILKSNGMQYRDFIPFFDVVAGLMHLMELPTECLSAPIYNLGLGRSLTVRQIADLITDRCEAVLGFRPQQIIPEACGELPGEVLQYDIRRLQATGWQPKGDFLFEIDALLRYCKDHFTQAGGDHL